MNERSIMAIAAIASSILLVALLFSFAVFRNATFGAGAALLTAAFVYGFQFVQYTEVVAAEQRNGFYAPSRLAEWLFRYAFIAGIAAALFSIAGV